MVILNSKTNRQTHIVNTCRKTLSSVDFLYDGSHIATGEVSPKLDVFTSNAQFKSARKLNCGPEKWCDVYSLRMSEHFKDMCFR